MTLLAVSPAASKTKRRIRDRSRNDREIQSLPNNKHNEVKAKPSICLFLLKSEPWDKHIMLTCIFELDLGVVLHSWPTNFFNESLFFWALRECACIEFAKKQIRSTDISHVAANRSTCMPSILSITSKSFIY